MNRKFLLLLSAFFCAGLYSSVNATGNSLEIVPGNNYINTETERTGDLVTTTKTEDKNQKGCVVTIGLSNTSKSDYELEFLYNIVFMALDQEFRNRYKYINGEVICDIKVESLQKLFSNSKDKVVSFKFLAPGENFAKSLHTNVKEFFSGDVKNKLKDAVIKYINSIELESIKKRYLEKFDKEIEIWKTKKNSNSFGFGKGLLGNFDSVFSFNDRLFDDQFFGNDFSKDRQIMENAIDMEINKIGEIKNGISNFDKSKSDSIEKLNEVIDLLGSTNIDQYSLVSKSTSSVTTNNGGNLLTT